jgi:hypothetical protein
LRYWLKKAVVYLLMISIARTVWIEPAPVNLLIGEGSALSQKFT